MTLGHAVSCPNLPRLDATKVQSSLFKRRIDFHKLLKLCAGRVWSCRVDGDAVGLSFGNLQPTLEATLDFIQITGGDASGDYLVDYPGIYRAFIGTLGDICHSCALLYKRTKWSVVIKTHM